MKHWVRVLSAVLLSAFWGHHGDAQQGTTATLDTYIDGLHGQGGFNGNILIVDQGKLLLQRAVGDADSSRNVKLTLADRFQIGSIAKEFDSVGLLMLKQDGKLAMTDPLSKFFPELPAWASTITVDELLHYTSGLHKPDFSSIHSDAENWKAIKSQQKLDFTPGTQYSYNNNDVFLRRRIIEKVSGMSFAEFVSKRELPAADIHDAVIDPSEETPHVAKSFSADGKQDKLDAPISGWVSLSLVDFLKWSRCIQTFCLISPESTRLIGKTATADRQSGLGSVEMRGDTMVRHIHDGSLLHYRAMLWNDADKNRTILILGNQRADVYAMTAAIEAILNGTSSIPDSQQLTLQDDLRHRPVPVLLYGADHSGPKPLAVISHGYGGHDKDYSFLATHLVQKGYLVASIQHLERAGDPPMVSTGDIAAGRRPVWQVGADSIAFTIATLRKQGLVSGVPVLLVGHSNGGDMTMLFTEEHPQEVSAALSLDNRRMPLPRTSHPHICSVRSSNYDADPGVLPSLAEQQALRMVIVPVPVKHEDMWDGASPEQKTAILQVVDACLDRSSAAKE